MARSDAADGLAVTAAAVSDLRTALGRPWPVSHAERVVANFLSARRGDMLAAVDDWLTPNCVWSSSGSWIAHGKEACLDRVEVFTQTVSTHVDSIVIRSASIGSVVCVERVDVSLSPSGNPMSWVDACGAFRVRGSRIEAWHDSLGVTVPAHRALS
ncbi:MAG: limonene,2-epoxide hydrolase [Solirubrobacterales bacterium]|nr:limonene,2-epoxide hydrolase [Solirubrobacterales bacterium]